MSRLADTPLYVATHMYIQRHYGKEKTHCEKCSHDGSVNRLEWANISKMYKRERSDWMVLCVPCHRNYDLKASCKNGHVFTADNIYILTTRPTVRTCKRCQSEAMQRYNERKRNEQN